MTAASDNQGRSGPSDRTVTQGTEREVRIESDDRAPGAFKFPASSAPSARLLDHVPRIEGYRITGVIGQGGMGIVYRAVQTRLNRTVALKVLPGMVGAANPSAVTRFRREATAAARLHHTNIVPIYDFGESHDAYYYAMELIHGEPLSALIKRFAETNISSANAVQVASILQSSVGQEPAQKGPHPPDSEASTASVGTSSTGRGRAYYQQMARWMADAADALDYAHGEGIIHRDVKPANVILSIDGRILITDFGLAKSTEEESVTITGALLGTVRYLSPEQAMARRMPVDHRTDIYSLGATMYELLCFQPAFPGTDHKQVLAAIMTREPTPPRKVLSHVPYELETICLKALEKSADARYETARALSDDLKRYIRDLPIVAKRPGPIKRTVKFVRRNRAAVAAVTTLLALTALVPLLLRERRGRVSAQATAKVEEAVMYMNAEQWDQAEHSLLEALSSQPNQVRALGNLAITRKGQFLETGDRRLLAEGIELAEKALSLSPPADYASQVWNALGALYKYAGEYEKAADALERVVALDPDSPHARGLMANVNFLDGNHETAEQILRETVPLIDSVDPPFCHALRDLATVEMLRGKLHEARDHITQAITCSEGTDELSFVVRARLRLTQGSTFHLKGAVDDSIRADVVGRYRNPRAKRFYALAKLHSGDYDEAIPLARAALDIGDEACPNHLIIAVAEARRGDTPAARNELKAATATWPDALKTPGSFVPSADGGPLWYESADELLRLRREVEELLK